MCQGHSILSSNTSQAAEGTLALTLPHMDRVHNFSSRIGKVLGVPTCDGFLLLLDISTAQPASGQLRAHHCMSQFYTSHCSGSSERSWKLLLHTTKALPFSVISEMSHFMLCSISDNVFLRFIFMLFQCFTSFLLLR